MMIGRLKTWKDSYGFLEAGGKEYFVHVSEFAGEPIADEHYRFDLVPNDRHPGREMAVNVTRHAPDKQAGIDAAWEEHRRGPVQMGEDL